MQAVHSVKICQDLFVRIVHELRSRDDVGSNGFFAERRKGQGAWVERSQHWRPRDGTDDINLRISADTYNRIN